MKAIKGYFLFFSQHPIFYNLIWFIPCIMAVVVFMDTENFNVRGWYGLVLSGLFIGHVIIIYMISGKFITRVSNELFGDGENEWFRAVLLKNGEKIILNKPIWAKGAEYFVSRPSNFYSSTKEMSCTSWIQGRYKNSLVSFSVNIKHKLNRDFDKIEVFEALLADCLKNKSENDWLYLDLYINRIFIKTNERFQPKIDELVGKYSRREISEPELMDQLIDVIIFPERLFTNIEDVQLCLGNPTFSSCKGVSCPQ